jgi:hypothetical protein
MTDVALAGTFDIIVGQLTLTHADPRKPKTFHFELPSLSLPPIELSVPSQ